MCERVCASVCVGVRESVCVCECVYVSVCMCGVSVNGCGVPWFSCTTERQTSLASSVRVLGGPPSQLRESLRIRHGGGDCEVLLLSSSPGWWNTTQENSG